MEPQISAFIFFMQVWIEQGRIITAGCACLLLQAFQAWLAVIVD
jgi:hypothetical protein